MKDKKIDLDTLCELWAAGKTAVQIAAYFGTASQTVLTRISKMRAAGDTRVAYRRDKASKPRGGPVTDDSGNAVTQADYDALLNKVIRLERKLAKMVR